MGEINDLSTTDASNTNASYGFPENMNPSAVNDNLRALEGIIARWRDDINGSTATTGSSNTYAFAANGTYSAYYDGMVIVFDANHTNTGAATLNVDAIGAKDIKKYTAQAIGDVVAGDIVSGGKYIAIYDGTQFILINPSSVLDDYEEGTFTLGIEDAASGGNAGSASSVVQRYTKIGRLVHITIRALDIDTTGMTAGNDLYLTGMPFTSDSPAQGTVTADTLTFNGTLIANMATSATVIRLAELSSGAGVDYVTVGEVSSGSTDLYITITYETAS